MNEDLANKTCIHGSKVKECTYCEWILDMSRDVNACLVSEEKSHVVRGLDAREQLAPKAEVAAPIVKSEPCGVSFSGLLEYAKTCRRRSDELLHENSDWSLQWMHAARVLERIVEVNRDGGA